MNRFNRPSNAVSQVEQIPVGTQVWYVYGIYPPQVGEAVEVASDPFDGVSGSQFIEVKHLRKDGSYDVGFDGKEFTGTHSLLDANIGQTNHYNDNYFFLSKEAAENCVRWFQLLYDLNPPLVALETSRSYSDDYWNDYDDGYYDNDQ